MKEVTINEMFALSREQFVERHTAWILDEEIKICITHLIIQDEINLVYVEPNVFNKPDVFNK